MPLSAFAPENYEALLQEKVAKVAKLLARFSPPEPVVFASPPTGFRVRAEFRVWHEGRHLNYVMFKPGDPKTPYPIRDFPIADPTIQQLMPRLINALRNSDGLRRKLFQVEFLSTLAGETVVTLAYHRKLDEVWEQEAERLRDALSDDFRPLSLIGRSRKQKLTLGRDFVEEKLTVRGESYHYRQFEQAFSQPNASVNVHMLEWACNQAEMLPRADLLELYCGNGNFTLPLAQFFNTVIATEVAKSSTRAARANLERNGIDNVQLVRLSAEEVTQALGKEREFRRLRDLPKPLEEYQLDTLFVDPPRAGLDEQSTAMAAGFENILYISCNPESLATNLEVLTATHDVVRFALFDQFPYTHHMECGVVLTRRK